VAHRVFQDSVGRTWTVWAVVPERPERRRKTADGPSLEERRRRHETRLRLNDKLTNGWLAFETNGERRRFAPIPEDWVALDDVELNDLCSMAELINAPRPRLIE